MKWVRIGKRRINLVHTIAVEEFDGLPDTAELVPGGVQVTLLTGRLLVFPPGPDVETLLRSVDEEVSLPKSDLDWVKEREVVKPTDPVSGEDLSVTDKRVERG